jgi:hypothetical protein
MSIVVKALSALLVSKQTQTPAPPLAVDSWCIELTEVSSFSLDILSHIWARKLYLMSCSRAECLEHTDLDRQFTLCNIC